MADTEVGRWRLVEVDLVALAVFASAQLVDRTADLVCRHS